jgi:hypothetical protein
VRVSFALHFSHWKLLALTGTCCMCWHLAHLTFVALPVGVGRCGRMTPSIRGTGSP